LLPNTIGVRTRDVVTSVACLPVLESLGSSQIMWHCVVIGFTSGNVEVVSDAGQTLLRRQFADSPVKKIRANTIHLRRTQYSSCLDPVFLPLLSDVLVVYENMVALVLNEHLYISMIENRALLAEKRAAHEKVGEAMKDALANIKCKRMPIKDQALSDACIFTIKNTGFQMVSELSLNRAASQTSLSSLAEQTVVASVGALPFVQFNTPYNYMQTQNVTELAENVVSTVKSGLFRAATGLFWGGGGGANDSTGGGTSNVMTEEQRRRRDPEQKLTMTQAFKDHMKQGNVIELAPNSSYFAVLDNQNRVLLFDAILGTVIQVWKGYHHAQIGWVNSTTVPVFDPDTSHGDLPRDMRVACLLVIYLPRRGSIEIYSAEQKSKVIVNMIVYQVMRFTELYFNAPK
jgi:hypothetical protein